MVSSTPLPETDDHSLEDELNELQDDEIKMMMKELLTRQYQFKIEIYAICRFKADGRSCIEVDYSLEGICRTVRRLIPLRDRLYTIQFTMPLDSSEPFLQQYESVMSTVRVED